MKYLLLVLVIATSTFAARAGGDSLYSFDGYIGGGFVHNISSFPYGVDGLSRNGFNGYARMMWNPEHMLNVGVELGFTSMYRIDPTQKTAVDYTTLNAYPMYLVVSMEPVDRFFVSAGFGTAILASVVNDYTSQTGVSSASTSVFLALQYMWPVAERLKVGAEARISNFDRYKDANTSFNVVLAYSLIQY